MDDGTSLCIDERDHIGPHHLAIGKTRKLFERNDVIYAFYSRGYAIGCARIDARTFKLIDSGALGFPVAWGGGAFCVDESCGNVVIVFIHRNQHELCVAKGRIEQGVLRWGTWRPLLASQSHQAAPWVELSDDGTAWASVLSRDGDFRVVIIPPNGEPRVGDLFAPDEERWYHSCVQMLPVGNHQALAVGFRGAFPRETELVYKTVSAKLACSPSVPLAPCNVNDHTTFHFQAIGDPARSRAHIVYLDNGLSVSHAHYRDGAWHVAHNVMPFPCFAPQICLNADGDAALLAADYEGTLWHAAWSGGSWSAPRRAAGALAPNVSASFGETGYGSGGLIAAAHSVAGDVPYLLARMEDDRTGRARLYAGMLGRGRGLSLSGETPLAVRAAHGLIEADIRLVDLQPHDLRQAGACWLVSIPSKSGRILNLAALSGPAGLAGTVTWLERDGRMIEDKVRVGITPRLCGPFSRTDTPASLLLSVPLEADGLDCENAWVETYRGWGDDPRLIDLAPYRPETAAAMALDPARIPTAFRRMV